jgi:hypothetical protein
LTSRSRQSCLQCGEIDADQTATAHWQDICPTAAQIGSVDVFPRVWQKAFVLRAFAAAGNMMTVSEVS